MLTEPWLAIFHAYTQLCGRRVDDEAMILRMPVAENANSNWRQWTQEEWLDFACRCRELSGVDFFTRLARPKQQQLLAALSEHLAACARYSATYLVFNDARFPQALRHIPQPPIALTCLGNVAILQKGMVAVVGSRMAHPCAIEQAYRLGASLARLNLACVSGGAFGCDIAAHRGMLDSQEGPAPALVVFAAGLSHPDPAGNRATFRRLLERGGLWVSERLWHQPAQPYDFPIRNRIIAGLAQETVVIQAGLRSGAMVTAQRALDAGRDVLTLRLDAHLPNTDGNQRLLADGSYGFSDVDELLLHYRFSGEQCAMA